MDRVAVFVLFPAIGFTTGLLVLLYHVLEGGDADSRSKGENEESKANREGVEPGNTHGHDGNGDDDGRAG